MTFLVQQLLNGLVAGSTYALVALGFTLIFGIMRVLNLAYPEIYVWAAFGGYGALLLGLPGWAVAIAALLSAMFWSLLIDRAVLWPLRDSAFATPFIATIGVSIFLQNLAVRAFGPAPIAFPLQLPQVQLQFAGLGLSFGRLLTISTAFGLMASLWLVVDRTWLGKAVRATAENREAAECLGIDTSRVRMAINLIAGCLAGTAGFLIASLYNQVFAFMGVLFGLKAMVVMVLGGIGNVPGAMVGGVLLGVLESLTVGFVSSSYKDAIAFLVLIVVLVLRPQGLFGERTGVQR